LRVWRGREELRKKRKEQVEEIDDIERGMLWGFIFLHNQNPSHLGELKNCNGGGFWRGYMNSSNLIYLVIIFLKLKIY